MKWTHLHTATVLLLGLAFVSVTVVRHRSTLVAPAQSDTAASETDPKRVKTFWRRYRKATQYRAAGQMDSAATTYRTALRRRPTHHDALYYLGHVLYAQKKVRAARDVWERLLEANPKSARGHTQIGEVHFCFPGHSLFDLDRAEGAYQEALDLHNEETRPLLRLGTIALLRRDRSTARTYLEAARGANPNNPMAAMLKGYLAWEDGTSARATVLLRKAQNRYETKDATRVPACPLAERISAPLKEMAPRSSSDPSPYARLESVLQRIRTEHVRVASS